MDVQPASTAGLPTGTRSYHKQTGLACISNQAYSHKYVYKPNCRALLLNNVRVCKQCIIRIRRSLINDMFVQSGKNKGQDAPTSKRTALRAEAPPSPPSSPPIEQPAVPPPQPKPPTPPTLREAAALRAKSFREQYFGGSSQSSAADTDDAQRLRALCARMKDQDAVEKLLRMLQGNNSFSVSTFEFLSSGAIAQLKAYFTGVTSHPLCASQSRCNYMQLMGALQVWHLVHSQHHVADADCFDHCEWHILVPCTP